MHTSLFIQDLAVVMLIAGAVTLLFRRLKQPIVLGYLLAGFIIGPYTPPFSLVHDEEIIKTLAQLGVILLMFSLGLHFHLRKLAQVGITAFVAATFEILFMLWMGYELGKFFGANEMTCIFLGGILAISSTTIIVKAFEELGLMNEKFSELVFGILIIEDILAIALIALLSSIALSGNLQFSEVLNTLSHLGIFLTVLLVLGLLLVPPLLRYIHRFKSHEMMLVSLLALCFGFSFFAIKMGYSEALGAFIMGAIVAQTKKIGNVEPLIAPIKDMFCAIFFVSIGMMINPAPLIHSWQIVLALSVLVIVGKVLTCSFGAMITGSDLKTSIKVGMSLAQIGEFSFIIATLGLQLKVIESSLFPIVVIVSAITTFTTPYLIKNSDKMTDCILRFAPSWWKNSMELYTTWLHKILNQPNKNESLKKIKKTLLNVLINQIFVTALFIIANFASEKIEISWIDRPAWVYNLDAIFWVVAFVASLPFMVVSFRRLNRLGKNLVEKGLLNSDTNLQKTNFIYNLLSYTFLFAWLLGNGLWIMVLSITMFDNLAMMMGMAIIALTLGIMFWRMFEKIYSKAHSALQKTLLEEK